MCTTFKVIMEIDVEANNPLEAAKLVAVMLKESADTFIYDVENDDTKEKYTVDLSEEDEDAVLPNND